MSTREKIILSAVELFIQQGIARTTTKEIAASAGVAEGSIYRYFPSKDEMAWQIFDEYHQSLAVQLSACVDEKTLLVEQVESLVTCFLTLADQDWLMFRYYLTSQHTHMNRVKKDALTPYKVVLQLIENLIANKKIDKHNPAVLAAMVMGAVHQIATNKIYARITGELLQHKTLVAQIISNMLTGGNQVATLKASN